MTGIHEHAIVERFNVRSASRCGTWYVPEFAKFVRTGIKFFADLKDSIREADKSLNWKAVGFQVNQMRALPVVKQVIASLLALNSPGFAAKNPDLRKFVLDRELRGLPEKYRLYACLFAGPLARFAGLQAELNVVTHGIVLMSEVAHPPFAYLLTLDSEPSQPLGEITAFTTRGFDEVRDEQLELTIGFGHTALPGDYRSKAMVDAEVAANEAAMKEDGPIAGQSGEN